MSCATSTLKEIECLLHVVHVKKGDKQVCIPCDDGGCLFAVALGFSVTGSSVVCGIALLIAIVPSFSIAISKTKVFLVCQVFLGELCQGLNVHV